MTTQNHDLNSISNACLRLREITERKGQKITARDVATVNLAIASLRHLDDNIQHNMGAYREALMTSMDRGIQLDAVREMLAEIKEILG